SVAQLGVPPWESLSGARRLIVSPWEAIHYQTAVVSPPWEAMVALRVQAPGLWESIITTTSQSQLTLWEALRSLRGTARAPWEAGGPLVQVIDLVNLLGHSPTIAELAAWVSTITKLKGKGQGNP